MTDPGYAIAYYEAHPWILWVKITVGPAMMILALCLMAAEWNDPIPYNKMWRGPLGLTLWFLGGLIFLGQ